VKPIGRHLAKPHPRNHAEDCPGAANGSVPCFRLVFPDQSPHMRGFLVEVAWPRRSPGPDHDCPYYIGCHRSACYDCSRSLRGTKVSRRRPRNSGDTPSAVSHGIRSLEKWFGIDLFRRGPRGISPTAAGQDYLPWRVNCAPTFAIRLLMPALHLFRQRHPAKSPNVGCPCRDERAHNVTWPVRRVQCASFNITPSEIRAHRRQQQAVDKARES
jgi:hypothetical protein